MIVSGKSSYFKEIEHNLGYYPDFFTVQTLLDDGDISDGLGNCILFE